MPDPTPDLDAASAALAVMLERPPVEWGIFVPCPTCNARRGEVCRQGGWAWPSPARRHHAARRRAGLELWGVVWLLTSGHVDDVLGAPPSQGPSSSLGS